MNPEEILKKILDNFAERNQYNSWEEVKKDKQSMSFEAQEFEDEVREIFSLAQEEAKKEKLKIAGAKCEDLIKQAKEEIQKKVFEEIDNFCDKHYKKSGVQGWNRNWKPKEGLAYWEDLKQSLQNIFNSNFADTKKGLSREDSQLGNINRDSQLQLHLIEMGKSYNKTADIGDSPTEVSLLNNVGESPDAQEVNK